MMPLLRPLLVGNDGDDGVLAYSDALSCVAFGDDDEYEFDDDVAEVDAVLDLPAFAGTTFPRVASFVAMGGAAVALVVVFGGESSSPPLPRMRRLLASFAFLASLSFAFSSSTIAMARRPPLRRPRPRKPNRDGIFGLLSVWVRAIWCVWVRALRGGKRLGGVYM